MMFIKVFPKVDAPSDNCQPNMIINFNWLKLMSGIIKYTITTEHKCSDRSMKVNFSPF